MLAVSMLVAALVTTPASLPRECTACGVYAGPNVNRVTDSYLRQIDIWPEFYGSTCQFEVARASFVTLGRAACAAEASYRVANMNPRARS